MLSVALYGITQNYTTEMSTCGKPVDNFGLVIAERGALAFILLLLLALMIGRAASALAAFLLAIPSDRHPEPPRQA